MSDTKELTAPELREKLKEHGDQLRQMGEKKVEERSANWSQEMRNIATQIYGLDAELTALQAQEVPESRGPDAANGGKDKELRTWGQQFVESEQYEKRNGIRSDGAAEVRTLLSDADLTAGAGLFVPRGTPYLGNVRQRRLFVRDLLTVQGTGLTVIPYIRESAATLYEGGASAVAEGGAKPEVTMAFTPVNALVQKFAAWLPVTQEVIDDTETLMGYINNRLAYMLKIREEYEVLNGSGGAPHLDGILGSGVQTQTYVSGDLPATLGQAIGKVENVDGYVDGAVMNPLDFWTMVTTRHSNQLDGGFADAGLPFASPDGSIWGVPVVRTRGMTQGTALIGDFSQGATLFDKQETNIRTTDSHSDYFIYNKTVVLAEERIALAIYRPDFFVNVAVA